jgi:(4S)-4-hydroxy-5-phosphonooxypentane-2,3-dione isomerase
LNDFRNPLSSGGNLGEGAMLVLIAKYHVKPGKVPEVLQQLRKIKPLVQANEPGCKLYQVSKSTENDRIVMLYEHYDDDAALKFHRETAHFKEIIEQTVVPMLEKREREFYELVIP